ncbi:hypothetical protein BHE74_00052900, partial [Ensete ventricosum]
FAEGIGKLAGNTLGDRQKNTIGFTARMPEATGLGGTGIRKVEGTTFSEILAGKPLVSDGWSARTLEIGWRPVAAAGKPPRALETGRLNHLGQADKYRTANGGKTTQVSG